MSAPRDYVKYQNRRLYDRAEGKYVTLDSVRIAIISGEPIKVLSYETKEDMTREILLDIFKVVEMTDPRLSVEALTKLIQR
jgi:polyhydroxyalkanoate synthesis repressor PhaR